MGIQINGQTDTVTSTTAGGSVKVTPLAASTGLNVGTGASVSSPTTNVLTLGTNNTEAVRIDSSGKVGIGTTNPLGKFSVVDDDVYGSGFVNISEFLLPNAITDNRISVNFGKSSSSNNLAKVVYNHVSDGSGNNYLGLGFWNNDNILNVGASGNVGINTSIPASKLHVQNGTIIKDQYSDQNSANPGLQLKHNGTIYGSWRHDGRLEIGGQDSNAVIRLNPDGTTGIGTNNPSSMLHLLQSSGNAKITIQRSNTASNTDDYGSILWRSSAANNNGAIGVARESAENNGYMYFSTGSGGTLAERLRIDSGGRIMTGNYSTALDTTAGSIIVNGDTSGGRIVTRGSSTSADASLGEFFGFWDTNKVAGIIFSSGSDTTNKDDGTIKFYTSSAGPSVTERLRIDSSGRVNINTQSSYSYGLLTVQGGNAADAGNVNGLFVRGNGTNTSCPIYFNDEFGYPQKSIYQESYYLKIRGHNNEGVWILGSNASSNPSTNYKFNGTNNGSQCFNASNTTTWNTTSDQRIKENIEDLTNALDKIKQIRPVTFDYTDEYAEHRSWNICDENDEKIGINTCMKHHNVGYIAQEYKEVFPNDVTVGPEDIGDIHYEDFHQLQPNSVVPYLVKAVQELSAEVESLRAKIASAGL